MKKKSILELIGNTPIVKLGKVCPDNKSEIFCKLEYKNPGGSVKDRIALNMIECAEKDSKINKSTVIIEPTSGNTGIGIAQVCSVKGYRCLIVMPDSMSIERRKILKAYGAELVLTPASEGMKGAIDKAAELAYELNNSFIPGQFNNPENPNAHFKTTGPELFNDMNGEIDYFVAGVGTGGTISGAGKYLKSHLPEIKIIAVEPANSPVLSGGNPGKHKIQGIGAGFVPEICTPEIFDGIITVSDDEAFSTARKLASEEAVFCGISSGAAVAASLKIANDNPGKKIAVILPSGGERYLSTELFNNGELYE